MPAIKRADQVPSPEFCPTVISIPNPKKHYVYLTNSEGDWLATEDGESLRVQGQVDDSAIWDVVDGGLQHVVTGIVVSANSTELNSQSKLSFNGKSISIDGQTDESSYRVEHGPENLPSEYLKTFHEQGWVSLTCVLPDQVLDGLQKVGCVDKYRDRKPVSMSPIAQDPAIAQVSVEPVSLWLTRQYMKTNDIRLGHPPGVSALTRDDGKREVQGWHTDFPYLWGTGNRVPCPSGDLVLGIQRNVCVSDFNRENGATLFKLGTHATSQEPPEEWGLSRHSYQKGHRAKYGLPYAGEESELLEAPAGTIILYDARTWHRAGMNMTDERRGAMIQALIPGFIVPFMDTSHTFKSFLESEAYNQVSARVKTEIENLLVHRILGPAGLFAITTDSELTERVRQRPRQSLLY